MRERTIWKVTFNNNSIKRNGSRNHLPAERQRSKKPVSFVLKKKHVTFQCTHIHDVDSSICVLQIKLLSLSISRNKQHVYIRKLRKETFRRTQLHLVQIKLKHDLEKNRENDRRTNDKSSKGQENTFTISLISLNSSLLVIVTSHVLQIKIILQILEKVNIVKIR